ncbi:MAG: hypothetical protein HY301_02890 [Verrucomicrobia bacterium]|nr:hypothetical protein [Verrucomicrobiota bacterium]
MTPEAHKLGSVIICGGNSVHTFANCIACEGLSEEERFDFLRAALTELVREGLITWVLECDYGNKPAIKPSAFTPDCFVRDWSQCFPSTVRRHEIPDARNWTLSIDPTDGLGAALDKYYELHPETNYGW